MGVWTFSKTQMTITMESSTSLTNAVQGMSIGLHHPRQIMTATDVKIQAKTSTTTMTLFWT